MVVVSKQWKCLDKNRCYRYIDKYLDLAPAVTELSSSFEGGPLNLSTCYTNRYFRL